MLILRHHVLCRTESNNSSVSGQYTPASYCFHSGTKKYAAGFLETSLEDKPLDAVFTSQMTFLSPSQQRQSTEGMKIKAVTRGVLGV